MVNLVVICGGVSGSNDYELASSPGTPLDLAGIGALGLTLRNRLNHVTDAKGVAFTSDLGNQSPDNYAGTCPERCPEPSRRATRPEVQAVQLIEEGAPATDGYSNHLSMGHPSTYTYGGVPCEAREAKGKGKDGETYYTVKAVTGRKPGSKEYELKEEGAPVTDGPLTRVVISDIKPCPDKGRDSKIASAACPERCRRVGSFNADVKVMRDHYAFGMEMPGQIWQAGGGTGMGSMAWSGMMS